MSEKAEHVVVTGASQGIGANIAQLFAEMVPGVKLSLLARSKDRLEEVAEECNRRGATARIYPCDLTRPELVSDACNRLLQDSGPPTLLVNNAGMFEPGGITDTTIDRWRFQMDVNLTSAFLVTSGVLPSMLESGHGHVVFIASVASTRGYPSGVAYCASKHGLLGLARAIREETKEDGIRVTALLPGATLTASWDGTDLPDDRFIAPEDVAQVVLDVHRLSSRTVVEEVLIRPQLGDI